MEVKEKNVYIEGDTTPVDEIIRFRLVGTKKNQDVIT